MLSLYESLKAAGIQTDNHESDLYFPENEVTREILARYPAEQGIATRFVSQIDKQAWFDVPFAFTPYWERKQRGAR